ncbi:acyl carrier protein [Kitasatospora sp. NPDC089797]|uniref:acyl carrier protein n=1 Tax=Kitasatospora sp. NPDC089797 TaxID=3155298 RepID=UPI003436DC39
MSAELTFADLTALITRRTEAECSAEDLAKWSDRSFGQIGLDSMSMVALMADVEKQYSVTLDLDEMSRQSVEEFLAAVDASAKAQA